MRLAIVHDYLVQYGGAERVVEALHGLWPDAPIYTTMLESEAMPRALRDADVRTSNLQSSRFLRRRFKLALPLYPAAVGSFDLSGYDVVVSSSSGWAHGVHVDPSTRHLVYCHTPARWLYRPSSYGRTEQLLAAPLLPLLKRWDRRAAARPTEYVANSDNVRERIFLQYGRHAEVVHPPVDTRRFSVGSPEDFYLCAGRVVGYKRIDLAIEACRLLGRRLVVAGDGPARAQLERNAGAHVEFLGRVPDEQLASLLQRCRALIVPAEEDFCITAVEAMASGPPVVAFARGGLAETVVRDRTGVFFGTQEPELLAAAMAHLEQLELAPGAIRAHALGFDLGRFQERMASLVGGYAAPRAVAVV